MIKNYIWKKNFRSLVVWCQEGNLHVYVSLFHLAMFSVVAERILIKIKSDHTNKWLLTLLPLGRFSRQALSLHVALLYKLVGWQWESCGGVDDGSPLPISHYTGIVIKMAVMIVKMIIIKAILEPR